MFNFSKIIRVILQIKALNCLANLRKSIQTFTLLGNNIEEFLTINNVFATLTGAYDKSTKIERTTVEIFFNNSFQMTYCKIQCCESVRMHYDRCQWLTTNANGLPCTSVKNKRDAFHKAVLLMFPNICVLTGVSRDNNNLN